MFIRIKQVNFVTDKGYDYMFRLVIGILQLIRNNKRSV